MQVVKIFGVLTLAVVGITARSDASTVYTVPPGLSPGDTYRLVFVTADATEATSTNIADYNAFVTDEADAVPALDALGATWTVIGSTEDASAVDNIGATTSGIYTLDGNEVADGTAALFNTSTTELLDPIDIDQFGVVDVNDVWDGTLPNGESDTGDALGDEFSIHGYSALTNTNYLDFDTSFETDNLDLYAISSELTVPAPEPSTTGLTALGGVLLLLVRSRKWGNQISKWPTTDFF